MSVLVDSRLWFPDRVRSVFGKFGGLAGELLRSIVCGNPSFMMSLFVSHIRPFMDFCFNVWNIGYLRDTRLLELVQRSWTRLVSNIGQLCYDERLKDD